MLIRYTVLCVLMGCLVGCTSFKTSALLRLENDSVVREPTNQKLKGIPVKMKVPSHVGVTIYEQQILMANGLKETAELKKTATEKATQANKAITDVKVANKKVAVLEPVIQKLKKDLEEVHKRVLAAPINSGEATAASNLETRIQEELDTKEADQESTRLSIPDDKIAEANEAIEAASAPQYSLVSFTPAQLTVHTELIYTDKVFLVDFKRPAGGILDLKEARMDDEQYFANVSAEVTERTIADINTGLKTLTAKEKKNDAVPTSANTPEAEVADGINFQKSVIAYKRFDISEPGWEHLMDEFVKRYVGQSMPIEVCPSQQPVNPHPTPEKAQIDDLTLPPALSGADLVPPFSPAVE